MQSIKSTKNIYNNEEKAQIIPEGKWFTSLTLQYKKPQSSNVLLLLKFQEIQVTGRLGALLENVESENRISFDSTAIILKRKVNILHLHQVAGQLKLADPSTQQKRTKKLENEL